MTAAGQVAQFVVAQVGDHLAQPLVGAEEVVADELAVLDGVALELAVDGGVHLVEQHPVLVLGEQVVPLRAPDDLDDVPAGTAEGRFEFLDHLAVATHRAVEALQVAVDDEDQVVELLTRGERDGAERLGFVGLAVAEEAPDTAVGGVVDVAVLEVPVESGLVERRDRPEAHRHRRELPEVGHQARVRVRREAPPAAPDLTPEVVEVVLGEAPFEERAGVHARRRVALVVDVVAGAAIVLAAEEVVEPDLVQRGRAGIGRQVTADAVGGLVGPHHHHRRVPADERPDAPLDVLVAGEPRLLLARDRVDVRGRHRGRERHLARRCPLHQAGEQVAGPGLAVSVDDGVEAVQPLLGLGRIDVGQLVHVAVEDHGRQSRSVTDGYAPGRADFGGPGRIRGIGCRGWSNS